MDEYEESERGRDRRMICGLIFVSLVIILFLGSLATLIAYFATGAYQPLISAEASISSYNFTSSGNLTCDFDVKVTSLNPNSRFVTIYYGLEVEVYDREGVLLADQVFTDTFVSRPKHSLELSLALQSRRIQAQDLRAGTGSQASLRVKVSSGNTRFVMKGWKEFHDLVTVADCSPVMVKFNNSGSTQAQSNGSRPCSVNVDCPTVFFC